MRPRTRFCFTGLAAGALVLTVQVLMASGAAPPAASAPGGLVSPMAARRAAALNQENRARFLQLLAPRTTSPLLTVLPARQVVLARTLYAARQIPWGPRTTIAVAGQVAGWLVASNRPIASPYVVTPLQRWAVQRMNSLQVYSRQLQSRETYLRSLTPRTWAQAFFISRAILQYQRQQAIAAVRIATWGRIAATPIRPGG